MGQASAGKRRSLVVYVDTLFVGNHSTLFKEEKGGIEDEIKNHNVDVHTLLQGTN